MRELPPVEELDEGLWSLPVPIPDNPIGYTLVYVLHSPDGPVLVDSGWDHEDSWRALRAGLAAAGTRAEDVRGVVLTHLHPDHLGLVDRLRAVSGAWVAMHPADTEVVRFLRSLGSEGRRERELAQLRRAGAAESDVRAYRDFFRPDHPLPLPDRELAPGQLVDLPGRRLRAVWTPGHTAGHLCFHLEDTGHLFTGDHLLPTITPHIGLHPLDSDTDPLGDFLASLARSATTGARTALPAHEYRFDDVAGRAGAIGDHHEDRLTELAALLDSAPTSLWSLASRLSWKRDWSRMRAQARRMAAAETAAHLRLLQRRGTAAQHTAPEGVLCWTRSPG